MVDDLKYAMTVVKNMHFMRVERLQQVHEPVWVKEGDSAFPWVPTIREHQAPKGDQQGYDG